MTLPTKKVTPSSSSATTVTNYTLQLQDNVAYCNNGNKLHASTTKRQITRFNSKTTLSIATTVTNYTLQHQDDVTLTTTVTNHTLQFQDDVTYITNCTLQLQDGVNYQNKASRCFTPSQPVLLYQGELPTKRVTPCPVQKQQ